MAAKGSARCGKAAIRVRRGVALLCLAAALVSITAGCAKTPEPPPPQEKSFFTYFDTVSYVYSYAGDPEEEFARHTRHIETIFSEYHRLFDIYNEYPGINNLCTVNRLAGGEPVKVDEKLIDFLLYALELYETTDGEMNILLGSVLSIWHDLRTEGMEDPAAARLPEQAALSAAAAHTDISLLEIDRERSTVRLCDPLASIDVGALAKGYATEQAALYLEEQGVSGYVLNTGGNLRVIGSKPDGSGWVTAVRDPRDPYGSFAANVLIRDTACVTSGSYERFYTVDGKPYHHIIDRDTLWPAEHVSSLTVFTHDSGLADALSTALFCMPYEEGLALAEAMEGVEALWIFPDGTLRCTDGLADDLVD